LALIVVCSMPAAADSENGTGGFTAGSTTDGGAQVVVAVPGSSSGGWSGPGYQGGGGAASTIVCTYSNVDVNVMAGSPIPGTPLGDLSTVAAGTPVFVDCRDTSTGDITYLNVTTWNPATPPVLAPSAAVLAQMAVNSIRLPKPGVRTWPPSGSAGLVNLPVWLHVDNWAPVSASAGAAGLTATVTATPVRVMWDMDEGSVTCAGAGSVYDTGVKPDPDASSCSYTYRHSSGVNVDRTFHDSSVIVWHVVWTATNGEGGDLGEMNGPPTGFGLQIEESQALVVPSNN
jgi:hypothetical protein